MRAAVLGVVCVGLLAAGCGADGSGDGGSGLSDTGGTGDGGGSDAGWSDSDFDWGGGGEPATCPEVPPLEGSATFTVTSFDGMVWTGEYPSVTCETLHGVDGAVVGWLATFGEFNADFIGRGEFDDVPHFTILLNNLYAGDGLYDLLAFDMTMPDRARFSTSTLTGNPDPPSGPVLTLTDGGRAGTLSIGNPSSDGDTQVEVAFTCDPASPTGLEPASPFEPGPGRAYAVEADLGAMVRFEGVECASSGSFYARGPDYFEPVCDWSVFYVSAGVGQEATAPGPLPLEGGSYIFYKGLSLVWAGFDAANNITVESLNPTSGTFEVVRGFAGSVTGAFTCAGP